MSDRVFLALYRVALRLAPRRLRDRHIDEQLKLIHDMLAEEVPPGRLSAAAWKLSHLGRALFASGAAHADQWRVPRLGGTPFNGAIGDARLAVRSLGRSPWYAGSTVIVLGAGLALFAVVFAVVDGVLFKPLPYPGADRLFVIDARVTSQPSARLAPVSQVEIDMWTSAAPDLKMTTVGATAGPFNRRNGVDQLMQTVDEHFFEVIGVHPEFGTFLPEDFDWRERAVRASGPSPKEMYWPVVISHSLWRRDFGADPSIVGRRITVSEREGGTFGHIVRGVLPADFVFPLDLGGRQPDVLYPEGLSLERRLADTRRNLYVLARVGGDTHAPALETRLREVTQRESRLRPSTDNAPHGAVAQQPFDALTLVPVGAHLGAAARPALRLIAGGAGLLLLIICLNVTGLTAVRGVDRAPDFAMRRALGASSWRLARMVGIEVLIVVVGGVMLGLGLAGPLLDITVSLLPASLVLLKAPAIDIRVFFAVAITSIGCVGLVALFPAVRASRFGIAATSGASSNRNSPVVRRGGLILIGAQAALGFILVTGGALTITSLALAWKANAGYDANRTVLLEAYITSYANRQDSIDKLSTARTRLLQVPGVTGLAASNIHMFTAMFPAVWAPVGARPVEGTTDHRVEQTFFEVMGFHVAEGRLPAKDEWAPNSPYAVISETAARLWWPGEASVVGRRIASTRQRSNPERTVVAVVNDARYESLDRQPLGSVYLPIDFTQQSGAVFTVRTAGDPANVLPGLLAVARDLGLRLERAVPLDEALFIATIHRALPAWLFGSLGAVGLVVLAVGTFGLLAMAAAQRTRELVIRVALGASSTNVISLLVRDQLSAVVIGLGAGAIVSYWTVALLESQLYQVSPFSPGVWLSSAATLLTVAVSATLIPSTRRSRINPADALRAE